VVISSEYLRNSELFLSPGLLIKRPCDWCQLIVFDSMSFLLFLFGWLALIAGCATVMVFNVLITFQIVEFGMTRISPIDL
jgi:flagellar biosynthesis protein FlhB